MIGKKIKELITPSDKQSPADPSDDKKIILIDPASIGKEPVPEPDMRIVGLFADVHEEKIAEVIQNMLFFSEINSLSSEEAQKPIKFYLSTYGGNADDMFALYDVMRHVKQTTEIETIGLGKVMSAGVLLLSAGSK